MMARRLAVLFCLWVLATACDSESPALIPTRQPSDSALEFTPPAGASYVYRLDTFERVYEALVEGRVPLGLVNEVSIALASARIELDHPVQDLPGSRTLHLSIVAAAPRRDFDGGGAPDYEWWLTTRADSSPRRIEVNEAGPELRVALRRVGDWGVYVDEGRGWRRVEGEYAFGEHEVIVRLPIETGSPLQRDRLAYMRAVIRHRQSQAQPYDVGGVFPESGSWLIVSE